MPTQTPRQKVAIRREVISSSICVGGNWIELNMTADEFINKCNEPFKDSED